jgi:hypothetical protein
MAVIYANRKSTEKRADEDDKVRTITEVYIVKTDTDSDDQSVIMNSGFGGNSATGAIALPQVGDSHPTDSLVTVKSRSLEPTDNRKTWNMTVSYDNALDSLSTGGGGGGGGPQVLKVTIGKWEESYIMEVDVKGERFQNSAGDKIKFESTRPQIMMTFSSQTKDPDFVKFQGLQGTVNKNDVRWLGFNFVSDQVLFDEYKATSVGNNTWQEDFIFKMRRVPDVSQGTGLDASPIWGWQPRLLDAGYNELLNVDGDKQLTPILPRPSAGAKRAKSAVTQEWPLLEGEHIPADDIDFSKVFLQFNSYIQSDFTAFDFDFESILSGDEQQQLGLNNA